MKSKSRELSGLIVKEGQSISCQAILADGTALPSALPVGRYECEGHGEQEGRRFLRLRGTDGGLKVVGERELARAASGCLRRIYRKTPTQHAPPPAGMRPVGAPRSVGVRSIATADRSEAKKRLRRSIPESLSERRLGTYREHGSMDSWRVVYSIERRNGEWIIQCDAPDGRREASGFAKVEELIEDAWDRGYDPEDLVDDLRRSRRPHLITLADEVEEVATAKGWIRKVTPAKEPKQQPPAAQAKTTPAEAATSQPDIRTYVDDGGTRFYWHPPAPVCAFEAVLDIPDRAQNLTFGTPYGIHDIAIMVRAHRQGEMQPVLLVRGQATQDGRLQLAVENPATGESRVIDVETGEESFKRTRKEPKGQQTGETDGAW